jgi:methanogenic corrinoid protein MtbC1
MNMNADLLERRAIADQLRSCRGALTGDVASYFSKVESWSARYGGSSLDAALENVSFQTDCLAAAIESGSIQAFSDYAAWAAKTLDAKGIAPRFLADSLTQLAESVARHAPGAAEVVVRYIGSARALRAMPTGRGDRRENPLAELMREFLEAILVGNRRSAAAILENALTSGRTVLDLYTHVVQEALYEIGRQWQANQITVADEHRATAITQYVLAQLYHLVPPPAQNRGRVVIAAVQGEHHQVGSLLVSDALEADGWDVTFLGASTPCESIVKMVGTYRPHVLGLSVSMLFNLPALVQTVQMIRDSNQPVKIVAGGIAVQAAPELCRELDLDGSPRDIQSTMALFKELELGFSSLATRT